MQKVGNFRSQVFAQQHQHMTKVAARWVARLLTAKMKEERIRSCKTLLEFVKDNHNRFTRLVTLDETWLYQYDPEMKCQSKQWKTREEPTPKKAKVSRSAVKVMLTVFWGMEGVIMLDYLPKNKTMNGEYYSQLLEGLKQ